MGESKPVRETVVGAAAAIEWTEANGAMRGGVYRGVYTGAWSSAGGMTSRVRTRRAVQSGRAV